MQTKFCVFYEDFDGIIIALFQSDNGNKTITITIMLTSDFQSDNDNDKSSKSEAITITIMITIQKWQIIAVKAITITNVI